MGGWNKISFPFGFRPIFTGNMLVSGRVNHEIVPVVLVIFQISTPLLGDDSHLDYLLEWFLKPYQSSKMVLIDVTSCRKLVLGGEDLLFLQQPSWSIFYGDSTSLELVNQKFRRNFTEMIPREWHWGNF